MRLYSKACHYQIQQLLLEMENILHNCCNPRYHQVETDGIINLVHGFDEVRCDFGNRLCEVYKNHECDCDICNVRPQLYMHTVSKERRGLPTHMSGSAS